MKRLFTTFLTAAAAITLTAAANAAPLALDAVAINTTASGTTEKVAPGNSFENATKFPNINITFKQSGVSCGETLQFTSDKGLSKEVSVNHMFYDMGYSNEVIVKTGDESITESGVYTLHVPANFFSLDGSGNDATDLAWTYTNTTDQGDDNEKELKLTGFTVNGVDMLAQNPALALLERDVPINIDITPIPEAMMLTLKFSNKETGELIRSMEIYSNPNNPAIVVDPATGVYHTKVAGRAVNKFFEGSEYAATITAYSSTNANNPANQVWGPVEVAFTGLSEVYKFSPATIVSVSPSDGSEITDVSTPIVVTFSSPVAEVKCSVTAGGQGASANALSDITANADKTVWTIRPGRSFWSTSDTEWTFMISAKDAEGRVVEGNHGLEANSQYWLAYGCFLAAPTVNIAPASGMVEELYEFTATDASGISLSYTSTPYVVNEAGETVARVDMNSQVQYDAQGRDITTVSASDVKAVKAVFHLTQAITTPGKYKFILPHASFSMGTEYSSSSNRYMEIEYTVVPMVAVNVELADFAKASFKVSQGNSAKVALTPSADWRLATLTLNGTDVTDKVAGDVYTIENITEEASLVATYEFAHEVQVIETGGTVGVVTVENNQYKVSSTAECIKIESLKGGEEINVFTAAGMRLASQKATKDTIEISVPQGQVYIVTINNVAVKVKH